jgi:anti-sigma factor RsiW
MRGPIDAFLDGELAAAEAERVRRHLKECWCCSGAVDVGRAMRAALRQMESPRSLADARLRRFATDLGTRAGQRR